MDEKSKSNAPEETKELTAEELSKVAGGSAQAELVPAVQEKWVELESFQWGVGNQ
jgi:hypothetical protein